MLKLLSTIQLLIVPLIVLGQIHLSIPSYDRIDTIHTESGTNYIYYKAEQKVLTRSFPVWSNTTMTSSGNQKRLDSLYNYYNDSSIVKYQFYNQYTEKTTSINRLQTTEQFYLTGKPKRIYSEIISKGDSGPSYKINDEIYFNESGDTLKAFNHNTLKGKKLIHDSTNQPQYKYSDKLLGFHIYHRLQTKADSLIKSHYGQAFFDTNIKPNNTLSNPHWDKQKCKSLGYRKQNDKLPPEACLEYIDFAYRIVISESEQYSLIQVRVSTDGTIIYKDNGGQATTFGLIKNKSDELNLNKNRALKIALDSIGISQDSILSTNLVFKRDDSLSHLGKLFYQIHYNQLIREINDVSRPGNIINNKELLVDVTNDEIIQGEYHQEKPRKRYRAPEVKKIQNKTYYGFIQAERALTRKESIRRGGKPKLKFDTIIPPVYSSLPEYLQFYMISSIDEQFGLISHTNEVLLPFEFDRIYYLTFNQMRYNEYFLLARKNNKYWLYNYKGELVHENSFSRIEVSAGNLINCFKGKRLKQVLDPETLIGK